MTDAEKLAGRLIGGQGGVAVRTLGVCGIVPDCFGGCERCATRRATGRKPGTRGRRERGRGAWGGRGRELVGGWRTGNRLRIFGVIGGEFGFAVGEKRPNQDASPDQKQNARPPEVKNREDTDPKQPDGRLQGTAGKRTDANHKHDAWPPIVGERQDTNANQPDAGLKVIFIHVI